MFVFLVALGIDYNIFLMTRVREETPEHGTRRASLIALGATGGVITSAGLVLAATFAVLATLPLVAFAEIGMAVALGVLLDTLVVRSVLVTAINLDVGGQDLVAEQARQRRTSRPRSRQPTRSRRSTSDRRATAGPPSHGGTAALGQWWSRTGTDSTP